MTRFPFCPRPLVLTLASLLTSPAIAQARIDLSEVVVTGARMEQPLIVETDLKVPRQPLPAHDGADYLKTVPGFSVIRKGGTDGDPILRGMAGSRLNILVDGQTMLGGCNMRMDAPTAYIFPEAFDTLTVIKGPQSVIHGAGSSAGTVLFERDPAQYVQPGYRFHASLLGASFGRHDEVVDAQFGNARAYAQITGTHSQSGNYKDGDGNQVHSRYQRYSGNLALGVTPDRETRIEFSAGMSDGYAAYADRGMDGTQFLRENVALKFEKKNLSNVVEKLEAQIYQNKVDHIMDDQELRTPSISMMMPRGMGYANLKRDTEGARIAATLRLAEPTKLVLGWDAQNNSHESRSSLNPMMGNLAYGAWTNDAEFKQQGLFGELTHRLDAGQRLIAGYRADFWQATDQRSTVRRMGMPPAVNPTAGQSRDDTLHSGFVRHERQLAALPATAYVGLGHAERFPDYWELIAKESAASVSAFDTLKPEKTDQLDAGLILNSGPARLSVSAFYNQIRDFILIDYRAMNARAGNVDATTHGGEIGVDYAFSATWKMNASLAYVRGRNDSTDRPLAQLPPLEGRFGLSYDNQVWSVGGLLRLVAKQDRFDLNQGNIVGRDLGPASGFAIVSVNAAYRVGKRGLVSAGIDNLFDKTYAEFVSRAGGNGMGGAIPGYLQTTRVNEPGRTAWLKLSVSLD